MRDMFTSPKMPFYQSTTMMPLGVIEEQAYYDFASGFFASVRRLLKAVARERIVTEPQSGEFVARHGLRAAIESTKLEFLGADRLTMTPKEFKNLVVKIPDVGLGEPTKVSLRMASTGIVSGTIKWGKVTGKVSGVVIGGKGVGLLTVTQKAGDQVYAFSAEAAKQGVFFPVRFLGAADHYTVCVTYFT